MRYHRVLSLALLVGLVAVSTASAQPDNKFAIRFGLFNSDPQAGTLVLADIDTDGKGIGFETLNPDGGVGFEFGFEWYASNIFGIEPIIGLVTYDYDLFNQKIAEQDNTALRLNLNFHPYRGDRVDFYVGPSLAWNQFDDIKFTDDVIAVPFGFFDGADGISGEIADVEVARDYAIGLNLGLDINFAQRWLFYLGLRWYRSTAVVDGFTFDEVDPVDGDPDIIFLLPDEIRIDPLEVRLGIGYRFGGGI